MLQMGAAWFDTVAKELSSGAYGMHAADTLFEHRHDRTTATPGDRQWAARAVLVDMEPKVGAAGGEDVLPTGFVLIQQQGPGCCEATTGCTNNVKGLYRSWKGPKHGCMAQAQQPWPSVTLSPPFRSSTQPSSQPWPAAVAGATRLAAQPASRAAAATTGRWGTTSLALPSHLLCWIWSGSRYGGCRVSAVLRMRTTSVVCTARTLDMAVT